jgi:protein phosphatase
VGVFVVLVLGLVGGAVAAVAWYARSAYYVGVDQDRVAIYRGRPGGLLWIDPVLYERKRLTVDELLPASRSRLEEGHPVSSKAEADRYVNRLAQDAAQRRAAATTTTTVVPPPAETPGPPGPATSTTVP